MNTSAKKGSVTAEPEAQRRAEPGATTAIPQDRYHAAFLAALTGFSCNPKMVGGKVEEAAAEAAQRAVESDLDLHPRLRDETATVPGAKDVT